MTAAVLPITGYLDRLSRRPGERLRAHVALRRAGSYRVRLVRVISADPNPAGPGLRFEDMSSALDDRLHGGPQPIRLGSYGIAPVADQADRPVRTWTVLAWMAGESQPGGTILSHEDGDCALTVRLSPCGLEVMAGPARLAVHAVVQPREWYRIWIVADCGSGTLSAGIVPANEPGAAGSGEIGLAGVDLPRSGEILIGARDRGDHKDHFDGRIEDPALIDGERSHWPDPLISLGDLHGLVAAWDFSQAIGRQTMPPVGTAARAGRLVNLPMAAVRGARWTGEELCWRHAPAQYGAIHFHSDDIGDCAWPESFAWTVPDDLASGSYAFHLACDDGEDWLPFYVLPPRHGRDRPAVAFLAPTFTYQAYANHARGNVDRSYRDRVAAWNAYPHNADDYPIYGRSTYNRHPDGSGIAYSTRLRPMLTMRPGYLTFDDANGSGLRHYPADSHLLAWLEDKGIAFDIVTDEDLHEEGVSLLSPYRLVLTGTHPEYHTARTWDAIHDYTHAGGRLAYLGGNGFYWRIGRDDAQQGTLEMRRSEGGTRAWASEPGEYYNALDGCYSGMWRRNGRDPQKLVGVGFTGQARFEATHFRRSAASKRAGLDWVFDGIDGDVIGDYGLSAGGAAGFEFDRADVRLGTPRDAILLATSEDPPASCFAVMEELLGPALTLDGGTPEALVRADMVLFGLPGGGGVFAAGSITFCGSLWRGGFDGPVSRLLENVLEGLRSGRPLPGQR